MPDEGQGPVVGPVRRRRERQGVARSRVVKFVLTEDEHADVQAAAQRLGLARGAYAALAVLAAAREVDPPMPDPLREALIVLMRAGNQVRRIGVNLNQAVAALNATGEVAGDLVPYAAACVRTVRRLDGIAEAVRKQLR
ncbi:hypothetical protein [Streptosporangium sp. KLBMP 9127]|nr:hypothetical protein [Streptosporangium sp. KLBMP 9127]